MGNAEISMRVKTETGAEHESERGREIWPERKLLR